MPEVSWKTGAYCILNRVNRKVYVGGAYVSFRRRLQGHRAALRRGDHYNRHLQAAWDKYGVRAFTFRILERCRAEDVRGCEQKWIDYYQAANREKGYNNSPTAGSSLGVRLSAECRANMKKAKSYTSPETRERMAAAKRGRIVSVEERNRSSVRMVGNSYGKYLRGIKHTAERNHTQSVAMLGNQNGKAGAGRKKHFLTIEQRLEVIRLYATKTVSQTELAKRFVVSVSTISKITKLHT